MGIRKTRRFLCRLVHVDLHRLWLFTRILLPDVMLTLTIALAMWAFLRVLDAEERHPRAWAATLAASLGSRVAAEEPDRDCVSDCGHRGLSRVYATALLCLVWKRLRPLSGLAIMLLIAAPWHILATLRNPPYFSFTMKSIPGEYHGFLWFFFINEQLLRFLNFALSARLQHGAAPLFLAAQSGVAFSLERIPASGGEAVVQARGSRREGRGCWHCAGLVSCWSFSHFRRRRSTTPCRAIRRSRC